MSEVPLTPNTVELMARDGLFLHSVLTPGACRVQGYLAIRNRHPVGPCSRTMPRLSWRSWGGMRFLMSEIPLYMNPWPRKGNTKTPTPLGPLGTP